MHDEDHLNEVDPNDEAASPGDPHDHSGTASEPAPPLVSSARIVYCTSCGCQLEGLRIGEPCPNCQVPVGSAAKTSTKTNGKAITALVLGICSFVGCMLYGLPGIVCAILAIVFANKVRRGVAAGEMNVSSLGMANAGRICGIVGLCASIAYLLLIAAWMTFVFVWMMPQQQQTSQQMFQQMQQQQMQQQIQTQQQMLQNVPPTLQPVPDQATPAPWLDTTEPETPTTNP